MADWEALLARLGGLDSLLVAYSGGTDSTLLLTAAAAALGPAVTAALCLGPFTPEEEADRARHLAGELGVHLVEMDAEELLDRRIAVNDADRCYYCKDRRLALLQEEAMRRGLAAVAEGSQADDLAAADRPGSRAVRERGVLSPLAEAGLTKERVRRLSRLLNLPTADLPAAGCLATRVAVGSPLEPEALARVERAEAALRKILGSRRFRVRDHYPLARLELDPGDIPWAAGPGREELAGALLDAGYRYACLDLLGYRPGGRSGVPEA